MLDLFTKWVEAKATMDMRGPELARILQHKLLFFRYGAPKQLHNDQGANMNAPQEGTRWQTIHLLSLTLTVSEVRRSNLGVRHINVPYVVASAVGGRANNAMLAWIPIARSHTRTPRLSSTVAKT